MEKNKKRVLQISYLQKVAIKSACRSVGKTPVDRHTTRPQSPHSNTFFSKIGSCVNIKKKIKGEHQLEFNFALSLYFHSYKDIIDEFLSKSDHKK